MKVDQMNIDKHVEEIPLGEIVDTDVEQVVRAMQADGYPIKVARVSASQAAIHAKHIEEAEDEHILDKLQSS
jgi:hypothetical protein